MEQIEKKSLSEDALKVILQQALTILKKPISSLSEENFEVFANIFLNTQFFQRNLDPQINHQDFLDKIKTKIGYEVYPYGSIIVQENTQADDKLKVILKGSATQYLKKTRSELVRRAPQKEQAKTEVTFEKSHSLPKKGISPQDFTTLNLQKSSSEQTTSHRSLMYLFNKTPENTPSPPKKAGHLRLPSEPECTIDEEVSSAILDSFKNLDQPPARFERKGSRSNTMTSIGTPRRGIQLKGFDFIANKTGGRELFRTKGFQRTLILELEEEGADEEESNREKLQKKFTQDETFVEFIDPEEDVKIFKDILAEDPDAEDTCFFEGKLRFKRRREFKEGDCLGEHFFREHKPNEKLLIATKELHVLTISKEDYAQVLSYFYEKNAEKAEFFTGVFPFLSEDVVRSFSYRFKEKVFHKGEKIYSDGENALQVYFLKSGNVQLVKTIEAPSKSKQSNKETLLFNANKAPKIALPITNVIEGQFFGDEMLVNVLQRTCSAVAKNPNTIAYFLDQKTYGVLKKTVPDLFKLLDRQAKEKLEWRIKRIEKLVESTLATHFREKSQSPTLQSQPSPLREKSHSPLIQPQKHFDFHDIPSLKLSKVQSEHVNQQFVTEPSHEETKFLSDMFKRRKWGEIDVANKDGVANNLVLYKEKFSRKNINEKGLRPPVISTSKHSFDVNDPSSMALLDKESPKSLKLKHKKSVQLSPTLHPLPKLELKSSLILSPKEDRFLLSSHREHSSKPAITVNSLCVNFDENQKTRARSKTDIFLTLLPEQNPVSDDGLIKNSNGSLSIIDNRARLRQVLKKIEVASDAQSTPISPRNGLLGALISPKSTQKTKTRPKLVPINRPDMISPKTLKQKSEKVSKGFNSTIFGRRLSDARVRVNI